METPKNVTETNRHGIKRADAFKKGARLVVDASVDDLLQNATVTIGSYGKAIINGNVAELATVTISTGPQYVTGESLKKLFERVSRIHRPNPRAPKTPRPLEL